MDAAALPVQGTETRVNAGNEVCGYSGTSASYIDLRGVGYGVYGELSDGESRSRTRRNVEGMVSLVRLIKQ